MKKILIPDEYICAIFSTVGYGLGYSIPCALGVPGWLSAENAEKLKNWLDNETELIGKAKAESKFINLWLNQGSLLKLSEALYNGGSTVRTLYWDVDAVVKELGVGTVNIVCTILGNHEAAAVYGNVVNESIQKILQGLILKMVRGEEAELYTNEVGGNEAIKWETYPGILAVTKDSVRMKAIEETLSDAMELI